MSHSLAGLPGFWFSQVTGLSVVQPPCAPTRSEDVTRAAMQIAAAAAHMEMTRARTERMGLSIVMARHAPAAAVRLLRCRHSTCAGGVTLRTREAEFCPHEVGDVIGMPRQAGALIRAVEVLTPSGL